MHASTPTSPGQPGFRLIDSLPFPPQRRPAVPAPSSQTTRESLFVIHELVCGLGYRTGGRDRGNRKRNKPRARFDSLDVNTAFCLLFRISGAEVPKRDGESDRGDGRSD